MEPLDLGYGLVLQEEAQKLIIALAILGLVQILFGVASMLENSFSEGLKKLQIFRKLQHATTCLMILGVHKIGLFNKHQMVQYLCYTAIFVRVAHSSRHLSPKINEAFLAVFGRVFSKEEVDGEPPVAVFTLWGLAAVIGAFPPGVAYLAILGLSIGTSFAELAGQVAKRQLIFGLEGKSYVGCIWNAVATATATMAFLAFQDLCLGPIQLRGGFFLPKTLFVPLIKVMIAVFNGVISAIADIFVIGDMNGNLTMPITAAFVLGTIAGILPPCEKSMKETSIY
mmetsp:Transcript_3599/g.4904  ORF Transcript_3599/g.4904 Transcript_3599/m.4904 type:complete len:283 (-) Transcript_3599:194-1042(-)